MTGTATARALLAAESLCELPAVLAGTALGGSAARLARMLDHAFLIEAGWDPKARVLSFPSQNRLLGRTLCRVDGCVATAHVTKAVSLAKTGGAQMTRASKLLPRLKP